MHSIYDKLTIGTEHSFWGLLYACFFEEDEVAAAAKAKAEPKPKAAPTSPASGVAVASGSPEFRVCARCGVYEPFEGLTDDCCQVSFGVPCVFSEIFG